MTYFILFLLMISSASAGAGVYKWVDKNGQVHYSDQAPPAKVAKQKIRSNGVPYSNLEEERVRRDLEAFKTRFRDAPGFDRRVIDEQELILKDRLCAIYSLYYDGLYENLADLTPTADQRQRIDKQLQFYAAQRNRYCGAI
jgi:hypothetical protein